MRISLDISNSVWKLNNWFRSEKVNGNTVSFSTGSFDHNVSIKSPRKKFVCVFSIGLSFAALLQEYSNQATDIIFKRCQSRSNCTEGLGENILKAWWNLMTKFCWRQSFVCLFLRLVSGRHSRADPPKVVELLERKSYWTFWSKYIWEDELIKVLFANFIFKNLRCPVYIRSSSIELRIWFVVVYSSYSRKIVHDVLLCL